MTVDIKERRLLEIRLLRRPDYAIAGKSYTAEFVVRNRGNAQAPVAVSSKSTFAKDVTASPSVFSLTPGEARAVKVTVATRKANLRSGDDVLEVSVAHTQDVSTEAHISSNITVVQPAGYTEPRVTVPAVLKLRGAPSETAAPFEFSGGGSLRSVGNEQITFLARGPSGKSSAFGERDEYRVGLESDRYSINAGDNLYRLSPLLGDGQPGFGGSARFVARNFNIMGFGQKFRYQGGNLAERGASIGWTKSEETQLSLNAINRPNGVFTGSAASISGLLNPVSDMKVEFDVSSNVSSGPARYGRSLHVNGAAPFQYDVGHVSGDSLFLGPARGIAHTYGVISGSPFGELRVNAAGSEHRVRARTSDFPGRDELFRTVSAGLAWDGVLSLDLAGTKQKQGTLAEPLDETERSATLRTSHNFSFGNSWISAERGNSLKSGATKRSYYGMYSAGTTVNVRANSFSLFGDYYTGGSITRGPIPYMNVGGSAWIEVTPMTRISVIGFSAHTRDGSPGGYSQIDTRITQTFSTGSSISVRTRRTAAASTAAKLVGYLEYSLPIGVPTFRSVVTGRATGRIVDSETGRGIPNTLVRLGPQAAITDHDGRVYFSSLPAGEYRASLAQETTTSDRIFIGDPQVTIDTTRTAPATFALAVDRPATVQGSLKEWLLVKTGIGNQPDSLREGGELEGVTIALMSKTDTLYRLTDLSGRFTFREIPHGEWTLKVASDPPTGKKYDPVEVALSIHAGDMLDIPLRLIPQRRAIRMIGGSEETPVPQSSTPPVRR